MNPNQIPQNPIRELDEFYVKDEKVLQADSEQIANDWFKQRDDENFQKELQVLTQELQLLDEGKFIHPILRSRPSIHHSSSIQYMSLLVSVLNHTSIKESSIQITSLLAKTSWENLLGPRIVHLWLVFYSQIFNSKIT